MIPRHIAYMPIGFKTQQDIQNGGNCMRAKRGALDKQGC